MAAIDDDDLILYHYDDGLAPVRREVIAAALAVSPQLRARYSCLRATLAAADRVTPVQPDADFERRLWQSLQARIATDGAATAPLPARGGHRPSQRRPRARWRTAFAAAASIALILGAGFFAGRNSLPEPSAPPPHAARANESELANRVLDAYVAAHLRQTEGVLLTALDSDNADLTASNAELAMALIENNRLYASAARSAGNTRLADFLRQMEPVLIELANPPRDDGIEMREGLRDYVRESDLLFQVRATEGALESRGNRRT